MRKAFLKNNEENRSMMEMPGSMHFLKGGAVRLSACRREEPMTTGALPLKLVFAEKFTTL